MWHPSTSKQRGYCWRWAAYLSILNWTKLNQIISHPSWILLMLGSWQSRWEVSIPFWYHTKAKPKPNQVYQTKPCHIKAKSILLMLGSWRCSWEVPGSNAIFIKNNTKTNQSQSKLYETKPYHTCLYQRAYYCWCWASGEAAERLEYLFHIIPNQTKPYDTKPNHITPF